MAAAAAACESNGKVNAGTQNNIGVLLCFFSLCDSRGKFGEISLCWCGEFKMLLYE